MPKLDLEAALNGPQLEAVRTLEGPVCIIAGAGSGKTRVITYRIAHMLERGIPQHAILALTFTNKAAREMESRVRELTGKKLQSLTVKTFHAFGLQILRDDIESLKAGNGAKDGDGAEDGGPEPGPGYRKNFSIYDETDREALIKESLRECRISPEGTDIRALSQIFSNIKTGRFAWGAVTDRAGATADRVWEKVYREYQHGLEVFNAVDFDDLLVLPLRLFAADGEILEKYRSRYRYLMVDEFQDTSRIQYRLLRMLAGADTAAADGADGGSTTGGGAPNVCVVGDDDQSIYSWRGANYENLLHFEEDFPGMKEIKLEQNYRSTTTILEAANGVISHNTNRKEKQLWSGNTGGKPIELRFCENEGDEAESIAAQIGTLMFRDRLRFRDFGVLVRTNSQFDSLEEAFLAANIPYRVSGGKSFFQRKEIRDILSYLRVIANPDDDVNLLRIINTPRRGIGKSTVALLSGLARKNHSCVGDAMERLRHAPDTLFHLPGKVEIDDFMGLVELFREEMIGPGSGKGTLSQKTGALVDRIDYWSYLVSEYSKNEKIARWKYGNIQTLIRMMEFWEKDEDTEDRGLYAYLNRISLITRDEGDEGDGGEKGRVSLMTIHASKGLEFPVVFIAGAEDGIIPHRRSVEEGNEETAEGRPAEAGGQPVEEERRLFYVAITRARDKLHISCCRKRRRAQNEVDCVPSPFLAEIPAQLIERHEEKEEEAPMEAQDFFARMRELTAAAPTRTP
ncbi:MAG: UvrD-helicase domain-containing protein [Treponema sp.]|jgi:DNA helicase-2/ATP-dependent DNA helicase PcrA|nr:UvrD-helicase domain-containing protein [Treponema sp.]